MFEREKNKNAAGIKNPRFFWNRMDWERFFGLFTSINPVVYLPDLATRVELENTMKIKENKNEKKF